MQAERPWSTTMIAAWSRAAELAERALPSRNRYVDFLRAASILVVTVGHWLAAAPYFDASGKLIGAHILTAVPWTAWLTWIVQVMPIFFIVGGYANGVSWRAARRDGRSYATWLESRLRRLVWPLLPLLVAWVAIVAIEYARGVRPELIRYGSQVAFIPIWFLAVYIVIVLLIPAMEAAWTRFGVRPFCALTAVSMVSDPDEPVSNTTPPKATLIALAIVQGGVLFAFQAPARRWLAGRSAWTATVLINANIMTLFIWHLTATTLVVLGSYLAGGVGLHLEPGSTAWWWSRIPWVAANAIALVPLVLAFGRFERPRPVEAPPAPPWRYVIGALTIGGALALLAGQGVGGYGPLGLNVWGLALAFTGTCLISRFAESCEEPA